MVMPFRGSAVNFVPPREWQVVSEFLVLGHIIADNGSTVPCYRQTEKSIWKAYFSNVSSPVLRRASLDLKLRLLTRVCRPPLAYRCSRWPPSKTQCTALNRLQTKLCAAAIRLPRQPHEAAAEYVRRRNAAASRAAAHSGRWSQLWCQRVLAWDRHVQRGHTPNQWSRLLLAHQNADWLETRRQERPGRRPGVRKFAGKPTPRWEEGIALASAPGT